MARYADPAVVVVPLTVPFASMSPTADLNFDGVVNVLDLIELLLAFGTSCT